jgi:hypothetical protein
VAPTARPGAQLCRDSCILRSLARRLGMTAQLKVQEVDVKAGGYEAELKARASTSSLSAESSQIRISFAYLAMNFFDPARSK